MRANLEWTKDDRAPFSSLRRDGVPALSLDFYCFTLALDIHLLVWHATRTPTQPTGVHMEIYDFDRLVESSDQRPLPSRGPIRARTTPTASLDFKPLYEGSAEYAFPQQMRQLDELLFFNAGRSTTLWHLQPARGRLSVYPQDWFNSGDWDYGYEWPTRVARDAETGVVFGEGIRIGYFALSPTMRTLQWRERQ
ncbi:MAG TPA: hypothetical protein VFN49_06270 [Candidatus Aquilonibacter sp.]|nr:hypothetical protein [Candidatus Aquilonibacter sp.]